jgi:hypothetical protein
MRNRFKAGVVLSLLMVLVLGTVAFGAGRFESIAGVYQIDITNLGMPLVFYLRIDADGAFMLSPNTNFDPSESRGEGVIGESQGVYMMIYKEHTADNPKTATFVLDGPNLVFQSTLPYGSSNIINSAEDPDNPDIVYTLTADTLALSDYYGTYAGGHSVQAMGSTVDYTYTLTLKAGLRYVFSSQFAMGGEVYTYTETGNWNVNGDVFTLVPAGGDPVQGTITSSGEITVGILPSSMARERTESLLRLATHADYAGTYVGKKVTAMYTADTTVVLDMFGGYQYSADVGEPEFYEETGSYDISGTDITFTPDGGAAYTGTLQNLVLSGKFKIIDGMPGTDLVMYNETVLGTFSGSATQDDVEYNTVLTLSPQGTYDLLISDAAGEAVVQGSGTFQMQKGMTLMVVLSGVDPAPSCTVSASGLNFSINLPGMDETSGMGGLGFNLKKQ